MPKRPRQSHIPQQATRRRKPRRTFNGSVTADEVEIEGDEAVFADPPVFDSIGGSDAGGPVETRPWRRGGRRLELLRGGTQATTVRVIPGQLPTYERGFLTDELRRIAITAGGLLIFVIVLAIILR